jgi:hypothetical protein
MGMLRRGNRDSLLTDRSNYERILRKYDRVEDAKRSEDGEWAVDVLIIVVCTILTIGSLLSILYSIRGA